MANVDGSIRIDVKLEEHGYKRALSSMKQSVATTTKDLEKLFKDMSNGMSLDAGVAEFKRIQTTMLSITQQAQLLRERFKSLDAIKLTLGAEDINRSLTRARELVSSFYNVANNNGINIDIDSAEFETNLASAQSRYNDFISVLTNTDIDLNAPDMDTIDLFDDTAFDAELADVRRSLSGLLDGIDLGSISRDASGIDEINSKIDELKRKKETLNKALQRGTVSRVEFEAKTDDIDKAISDLEKEKVNIEVELDADDSIKELSDSSLSFGDLVNADLLTEAIKKLAGALRDLGKASLESGANFQSSYLRIKDTFGEASNSIYAYAQSSTELLGMSETAFMKSAASIGIFAKSYIKDSNQLASVTTALTTAIADVSAQTGFSIDETMQKVLSGLRGNTEAIEELGVNVKVADMQTWLDTKGVEANFETLNSEMQNLYRTWYMLEKVASNGAIGYSAKMMGTYSGQVRVLKANFEELKTTMGTYLMQALVPVLNIVNMLLSKFVDLANIIGEVFGLKNKYSLASDISVSTPSVDTSVYDDAIASLSGVTDAQSDLTKETEKSAKAAKKALAPIHKLNILQSNDSSSNSGSNFKAPNIAIPDFSSALSSISGDAKEWVSPLDKFMDRLSKNKLSEKILKIKNSISSFLDTLRYFSPLLKGTGTAIGMFIGTKFLGGLIIKLSKLSGVSKVIGVVSKAFGIFKTALSSGVGVFNSVRTALGSLLGSFRTFMSGLSPLTKVALTIGSLVGTFITFRDTIKKLTLSSYINETGEFSLTWDNLKTAFDNILPVIGFVGLALYGMFGWVGVVAGVVVGLIGGIEGYKKALQELTNIRVDEILSNGFISIQEFTDSIIESNNGMLELIDIVSTATETLASNAEQLPGITSEINFLAGKIGFLGDESGELKTKMDEALGNLANLAKEQVEVLSKSIADTLTPEMENLAMQAGLTKDEINELLYGVDATTQSNIDKATEELKTLYGVTEADRTPEQTERIKELTSWLGEASNGLSEYSTKWISSVNEINSTSLNFKDAKEGIEYFEENMAQLLGEVKGTKLDILSQYDEKIRQIAKDPYLTEEEKKAKVDNLNILKASADAGLDVEVARIEEQVKQAAADISATYFAKLKEAKNKELNALSDEEQTRKVIVAINDRVSKAFEEQTGKTPDGMLEWYKGWEKDANDSAINIIDSFASKLNSYGDTKDFYGNIITSGTESAKKLAWNTGESIGNSTSDGIADGIEENAYKAEEASEDMAKGIEDAARDALDTHSPSVVFNNIGNDLDNGLAGGITDNKLVPLNAMSNLVTDLVKTGSDKSKFKSIGLSITDSIKDGIVEKAPSLLETVKGVFNDMAGLGDKFLFNFGSTIGKVASKLAGVETPDKLASVGATISSLPVPRLANGAVIKPNQRFLAELGDQTRGINIETPLSTMLDAFKGALADGSYGSGGDIVIPIYVNDELSSEQIIRSQDIARYRSNGK